MKRPIISIICALDSHRGIGKDNKLLWNIPEDLKRFRILTKGHAVIMGRKTHESIGRPLPERTNIIITNNKAYKSEGCIVVYSLQEALDYANTIEKEEIFIIGGGQIFAQALPLADKLYLTVVDGVYEADAFFPPYEAFHTILSQEKGSSNGYAYTYLVLGK